MVGFLTRIHREVAGNCGEIGKPKKGVRCKSAATNKGTSSRSILDTCRMRDSCGKINWPVVFLGWNYYFKSPYKLIGFITESSYTHAILLCGESAYWATLLTHILAPSLSALMSHAPHYMSFTTPLRSLYPLIILFLIEWLTHTHKHTQHNTYNTHNTHTYTHLNILIYVPPIRENTSFLCFWVWLPLFNVTDSRHIHSLQMPCHFSSWVNKNFIMYLCHIFLMYSNVSWTPALPLFLLWIVQQ